MMETTLEKRDHLNSVLSRNEWFYLFPTISNIYNIVFTTFGLVLTGSRFCLEQRSTIGAVKVYILLFFQSYIIQNGPDQ